MAVEGSVETSRVAIRSLLTFAGSIARFAGRRGVLAIFYMALGAVFEGFGVLLLIPILGLVISHTASGGRFGRLIESAVELAGGTSANGRLLVLLLAFATLMLLRGRVVFLRDSAMQSLQIRFIAHARAQVTEALADAGWDRVMRLRYASVLNVMSGNIERIGMAANFLLQSTIAVTILFAQCVISFVVSPKLALVAFALIVAGGFAMLPILRRARSLGVFTARANQSLIDTASQFLLGLKLAISQDLQSRFVSEFRDTQEALNARMILYVRQQASNRAAIATITAIVGAIVVFVGYGVLHLEPALLVTFLLVVGRMAGPAAQVQQGLQYLAFGLPAFEATVALVRELDVAPRRKGGEARAVPAGAIVFDSVGYRHTGSDGSGGLQDVSLSIAPGTFVGIAGASGAGKTTLADLMVGLLRPQHGRILIGDTPLDDSLLTGWRAQLAYISQDPFLFHDTLRRNLQWVDPGASDATMWQALECAGADQLVRRMPNGLDTIAGERGSLISGGERQRLAVARALLRRPRVLVMDEATNAIDIDGERALLERLLAMRPRLTIVMIAHRQESLALCDRILHLENGSLRASASGPSASTGG